MFPNSKFQKYKYSNRSDLESLLNIYTKNKGRLMRVIIFVNEYNIDSIAPSLDHPLKLGTFTIVCSFQGNRKRFSHLKVQYPKVSFISHSAF